MIENNPAIEMKETTHRVHQMDASVKIHVLSSHRENALFIVRIQATPKRQFINTLLNPCNDFLFESLLSDHHDQSSSSSSSSSAASAIPMEDSETSEEGRRDQDDESTRKMKRIMKILFPNAQNGVLIADSGPIKVISKQERPKKTPSQPLLSQHHATGGHFLQIKESSLSPSPSPSPSSSASSVAAAIGGLTRFPIPSFPHSHPLQPMISLASAAAVVSASPSSSSSSLPDSLDTPILSGVFRLSFPLS